MHRTKRRIAAVPIIHVLLNAGLLMLQLRPQSLALVSVFGLADSGAQVLAGAAVGSYLGRSGLRARCMMSHDVMTADMPKEAAKSQAKQGVPTSAMQGQSAARRDADVHDPERRRGRLGGGGVSAARRQRAARRPVVLGADLRHHRLRRPQQRRLNGVLLFT